MSRVPTVRPTPGRIVLYTPADQTPRRFPEAKEWTALVEFVTEGSQGIVCHLRVFPVGEPIYEVFAVPYDENRTQPAGSWRYPPRQDRE